MFGQLRSAKWKHVPVAERVRAFGPVVIAAISILVAGYYLDSNYQNSSRIDLRAHAMKAVALKASSLQAQLKKDLEPVRLIEESMASAGAPDKNQFMTMSRSIFARNDDILQIVALPQIGAPLIANRDGIAFSAPMKQWVPGKDSFSSINASNEPKISNIFLARPSVWAFSAQRPIFKQEGEHVERWGHVSIFIDAGRLLRKAGISYSNSGEFHYVMRPDKPATDAFKPFFRTYQIRTVFSSDPVSATIHALNSKWQVAAIPVGGWDKPPKNLLILRLGIAFGSALLIIPLLFSAMFRLERSETITKLKNRENELENVTRRLDLALESYRCGVWEAAINVEETFWDERMHELHGVKGKAGWATRKNWLNLVHPADRDEAYNGLKQAIESDRTFSHQCRVIRPDGTIRHIRYVAQFPETPGERKKLNGIAVDITEDVSLNNALRRAKIESEGKNAELQAAMNELSCREAELTETSQRLKLAVDAYQCGVWVSELEADVHYWDERMHELFDVPFTDGMTDKSIWLQRIHPEDRDKTHESRMRALATGERFAATYRIILRNGDIRHVNAVGQLHITAGGERKFIGTSIDVTEEIRKNDALIAAKNEAEAKRAELEAAHERIQFNAMHDPLTGLANRRALDEEIEQLSKLDSGSRKRLSLLHIDLDRFKQINDTLGHAAGDAMLVHAAKVLVNNTRTSDLVARVGGDEFVVVLQNDASNKEIAAVARRIIEQMNQPVHYEGHECRFGVSIGIAREQAKKNSVRKLMVNADIALYRAKASGRNRAEFFTANLQGEIHRTKKLADEILRGIDNGEFRPWYQPQFDSATHQLSGVEALVRWEHPERGLLAPDAFLKTAEEINALPIIDQVVLENALIDRLSWASKGLIMPKISVNVSARRLRDDMLIKSLRNLSICKGQIAFELVESIFLDDEDDVTTRNIKRIKSLGIDIEIDDFGTGHTSIVSLLKLEPKRLKIDRQLVSPMLGSTREFALVRSIIDIGKSLDIETIAEGVETMEHAAKLQELGCNSLQGYAFARPLRAEELPALARKQPWKVAV